MDVARWDTLYNIQQRQWEYFKGDLQGVNLHTYIWTLVFVRKVHGHDAIIVLFVRLFVTPLLLLLVLPLPLSLTLLVLHHRAIRLGVGVPEKRSLSIEYLPCSVNSGFGTKSD